MSKIKYFNENLLKFIIYLKKSLKNSQKLFTLKVMLNVMFYSYLTKISWWLNFNNAIFLNSQF